MATITVTTAADVVANDGVRSLREAVALANATAGADTIVFSSSLEGRTLTLTQGELVLTPRRHHRRRPEQRRQGGHPQRRRHEPHPARHRRRHGWHLRDLTLTHGRTTGGTNGGAVLGDEGTSLLLDQATVRGNTCSVCCFRRRDRWR